MARAPASAGVLVGVIEASDGVAGTCTYLRPQSQLWGVLKYYYKPGLAFAILSRQACITIHMVGPSRAMQLVLSCLHLPVCSTH